MAVLPQLNLDDMAQELRDNPVLVPMADDYENLRTFSPNARYPMTVFGKITDEEARGYLNSIASRITELLSR